MKDPTRIPSLMATLQEVWEAQPHLSLPLLLHQLQGAGITATSTDDDLAELLQHQLATHPLFITDANLTHRAYIVETTSPARRIILSGNSITVLPLAGSSAYSVHSHPRAQKLASPINETPPVTPGQRTTSTTYPTVTGHTRLRPHIPPADSQNHPIAPHTRRPRPNPHPEILQPTAWQFTKVRTCRVSHPLVIIGEGSIPHRLGVVTNISLADFPAELADIKRGLDVLAISRRAPSTNATDGLKTPLSTCASARSFAPENLEQQEWLFRCSDGTLALLGRRLTVFSFERRALSVSNFRWVRGCFQVDNPVEPHGPAGPLNLRIHTENVGPYLFSSIEWVIRTR